MPESIEKLLNCVLTAPFYFGQLIVQNRDGGGFILSHRDDASLEKLQTCLDAEKAIEIAKYDDAGNYRPLKTAPNLRHGWRMELATVDELRRALDYFYPGRLAVFAAWKRGCLKTTALRETLDRQSGMYRVAAKISDPQINDLVADFCRSNSGCLRTILWKRDRKGEIASTKLPKEKFDPVYDQASACVGDATHESQSTQDHASHPASLHSGVAGSEAATVPLLCQEPCNLLIADCRKVVKEEKTNL
jgi:DR2241 stabilising domain/4Fe-4S iron-sulfur cluster binding domain